MNPDLRKLVRRGAPSKTAIDRFIAKHTFPLVDKTDVTFIFRGNADRVFLRRWIYGLSAAQPLQRLHGSDLWAVTMELPEELRFEYKFEVVQDSKRRLVVDPLNPVWAHDPFGANSVCQGYRYTRPEWTLEEPEARRGSVQSLSIESNAYHGKREIDVYLPARFRRARNYPLLIVHDGHDYLRFAELKTVLDNLIHCLEIPEIIVALTQSPDRLKEYAGNPLQAKFIAKDLLPLLMDKFPLIDEPRARGIMGASFGAVAALHAAWSHPDLYGRLLLQSGSFAFSDIGPHERGPAFDPVVRFVNEFRQAPNQPAEKIYMSCGVYESLIYENRSLVPLLQAHGIRVRYEEARDAHNWENWRDRLRNGLSWLFPGPLWMVYE